MNIVYFIKLKNNTIVKDSFWALIGSVLGKGLAFVASIYIARLLGKEIYGEYGMIRNTLLSVATFSTFGLGYTSTKYIADYRKHKSEFLRGVVLSSIKITLFVSSLMAIGLFIFSKQVAIYLEAIHISFALKLLAINIIFNSITTTQIGILAGFNKFKAVAKNNTIAGLVTFFTSVVLTYYYQLNGALFALLISQLANCILNYRSIRTCIKYYPSSNYNQKEISKELIVFSFPVALQECIYTLVQWGNSLVLIKLTNYGELGIYSAAAQWASITLFIPGVLRNVTLSHLSGNLGELGQHDKIVKLMVLVNLLTTLIPFLFVVLFNAYIVSFYGNTFTGLGKVLNIAILSSIFYCISNVYVQEYMSKGKNWFVLLGRSICEVSKFGLFFIFIYYGTNAGAYYLSVASLIVSIMFFLILYGKYQQWDFKWNFRIESKSEKQMQEEQKNP